MSKTRTATVLVLAALIGMVARPAQATFPDGLNRTPQLVADELPDDAVMSGVPIPGRAGLQTNNPGWPGFASRGWISSAGLYLQMPL